MFLWSNSELIVECVVPDLLSVGFWVERSFCKEYWMFLWSNSELIVECVVPDLLHVIPVSHYSMLNRVFQGEDTSLTLGLISNIGVLLAHPHHHSLVARTTNNGGEDSSRCII